MSVGWNGGVMMMARVDEFTSYHRRLWAREPVRVWGTHSVDPATNYPQKFQEYKPPFFYQNLNLTNIKPRKVIQGTTKLLITILWE
jgi:hypothetical protein